MSEVSKIQGQQNIQAQQPVDPPKKRELKPDQRMEIREGMNLASVKANGSEAQKLLAAAFDYNNDESYDYYEAKLFNQLRFALDPDKNEIRMHNQETGCTATIKFENYEQFAEEIQNAKCEHTTGGILDKINSTAWLTTNGYENSSVVLDLQRNSLIMDGLDYGDGFTSGINVHGGYNEVTLKNCIVSKLDARWTHKDQKLNLINCHAVKSRNPFWFLGRKETDIEISVRKGNEPVMYIDKDSKVKIKVVE